VIKHAYDIGAELAYQSLLGDMEKEAMEKEAIFGLLRGVGQAARGIGGALKGGWGNFTTTTNLGRGLKRSGWLLGMGAKQGSKFSKFHHHWIGMPTGFGLINMALAPEEAHKGKAFLKGFAGGLAFNAAMPLGGALGKGLFRGVRKANPQHFKLLENGAMKPFGQLSAGGKLARGTVATGGLVGGMGLGIAASHAVEGVADKSLTQMGMRDRRNPFNPVRH